MPYRATSSAYSSIKLGEGACEVQHSRIVAAAVLAACLSGAVLFLVWVVWVAACAGLCGLLKAVRLLSRVVS